MFVIIGLGNPGAKYKGTRHNIGFEVVDCLAKKYNIGMDMKKHKAICGKGTIEGLKVLLVKPQTYMNLSGESVIKIIQYYKIKQDELVIIYDDVDTEVGKLRIREKGSAGGHNGIKDIISYIGSEFMRVRVGVGAKPSGWDLADHVLARFAVKDEEQVQESIEDAAQACNIIMKDGIQKAMNVYNKSKR